MADWFARLMQQGRAHAPPDASGVYTPKLEGVGANLHGNGKGRPARFDAIVQQLRDRDADDRDARAKRQRWYRQSLQIDPAAATSATAESSPTRLSKFSTKVPCRATPEARALLEQLAKRFPGCSVSFPVLPDGQQVVMLAGSAGTERKQIGWVERCVETDPTSCNVRQHGVSVETDADGAMLVLRFRYPETAVRMSCRPDEPPNEAAHVHFAEIRPAFDQRARERSFTPRLVWLTRPELETMSALGSREYEAFYVRFKLEVQAGIWSSLSGVLASAPDSRWHRGSCYAVVRDADAATRKIHQTTQDDSGRTVDIGADRVYDAAPATDILLLYLDGDLLADVADIYFTLQSLTSADAYFLKEEFFAVIRRFWAGSQSLTSSYGSDVAAVLRLAQRVIPMPAQAALLRQDWANLRQALVDRYGERGCKSAHLVAHRADRPRAAQSWPFATFPAGEINFGLRIVYQQEWTHLGVERGTVLRGVGTEAEQLRCVETRIEPGDATRSLDTIVRQLADATVEAMKWPVDGEGSIQTGVRPLASRSDAGIESECQESSRETCVRLGDIVSRMASKLSDDTPGPGVPVPAEQDAPESSSSNTEIDDRPRYVYSRLKNQYEVRTRPTRVESVVLVAEKLPAPAEIDRSWVRRHDWIIAGVLLDESLRRTLRTIAEDVELSPDRRDLDAQRDQLYEHLRANILHYQRAIWQQEDPQQRSMRYRKAAKKVPLDWRFELQSAGALTVEALGDRLAAANVDAQFAAYSSGRQADLDQVIDPAVPIGYYGNYAIYRMRPELGRRDAFSMLHFFKSPYLFANGEAEELRPEHTRRIALDTDGVVIDVMRRAVPIVDAPGDLTAGQLVLERQDELGILSAAGAPETASAWAILDGSDERTLRAGRARDAEGEPTIDGCTDAELRFRSPLGDADAIRALRGRLDLSTTHVQSSGMPDERMINAIGEPPMLIIGRAGQDQSVICARDDGNGARFLVASRAAPRSDEQAILSRADAVRTPPLHVGATPDGTSELIVDTRGAEERSILPSGTLPASQGDPVIITSDDERVILTGSGAEISESHDRLIHIVEEEWTPPLRVGAGAARAREVVVLVRDDEWLRPTLVAS